MSKIKFKIVPLDKSKKWYTYRQNLQISGWCGLIGYLRAHFGVYGNEFYFTWNGYNLSLNSDEFKSDFYDVINYLREEGRFLSCRDAMRKYIHTIPEGKFDIGYNVYGIRIDTNDYSYLMRLNPGEGEYNLYCYCYVKKRLDSHIDNANKGIRFIDSQYNELFRIPDGGQIELHTSDGKVYTRTCRYIDEYHTEIGTLLYHSYEFAEKMEAIKTYYYPVREEN